MSNTSPVPDVIPIRGVSAAMKRMLRKIAEEGHVSATTAASFHRLSRTVAALESRKLVEIVSSGTGRPIKLAKLTDQGRAWAVRILNVTPKAV